ncbi:MAG: 3-dehydroquinate synthase [Deltaproteobacteria bacterium]|nr:3-dehydroquinate synthase [Deltaproteobacteria bacterium]
MRPIVLWGPPASGKSTLSRALAQRLGRPRIDTDQELAERHDCTVGSLFERHREWGFRQLEHSLIRELMVRPDAPVIAVGGGSLLDRTVRHEVLERAWVLGLSVETTTLFARVCAEPNTRPLLQGPSEERVAALVAQRAEAYAECHATIHATGPLEEIVHAIEQALAQCEREDVVAVPLGSRTYRVHFAPIATLARRVASLSRAPSSVLAVTDRNVLAAPGVLGAIHSLTANEPVVLRGDGDEEKNLSTLSGIWDAALATEFDRHAVLAAIGGGVVTDLTGFAAATLLRGVRYVSAPTTVLAMADASVGGKTAIDHPLGKNLIGSFCQPSLVLCDVQTLATLSARERVAGLAEVAKIAAIGDAVLLDALEAQAERLRAGDPDALREVLVRAVGCKTRFVAQDEHESGIRAALNFGHTLGHAIELASGFSLLHGEAVALGMRAALGWGVRCGVTSPALQQRLDSLLTALGLPAHVPGGLDRAKIEAAIRRDKKRTTGEMTVILCDAPGSFCAHRCSFETLFAWL